MSGEDTEQGRVARAVDRWVIAGARGPARAVLRDTALVAAAALGLVALLWLRRHLLLPHPNVNMAVTSILALTLAFARPAGGEAASWRLLQWLGPCSALLALLTYPLMPPIPGDAASGTMLLIAWAMWVLALAAGAAAWWRPSLALVPTTYLVWVTFFAEQVTGLPHRAKLDVAPLPEVAACLGLALALGRLVRPAMRRLARPAESGIDPAAQFAQVGLLVAVSIHLANYFFSGWAKLTLPGPPLAWIWENDPSRLLLTALDNGFIPYAGYPTVVAAIAWLLHTAVVPLNLLVCIGQLLAIAGFLLGKRGLLALLAFIDLFHVGVAVISGANFYGWVMLNVAIAIALLPRTWQAPRPLVGLACALFIYSGWRFADVAWLGWFDTGANNRVTVLAEDRAGRRYAIAPYWFGFYGYPIGHMMYGDPEPATAFDVHPQAGAAFAYAPAVAGWRCDVAALQRPGARPPIAPGLARFLRDHHAMVGAMQAHGVANPFRFYLPHFIVGTADMARFGALPRDAITAYVYRRESVCLWFDQGVIRRRVISVAEARISVP